MRRRRGLTLIELIVVIAVIVLLMTFLMGVFARARAQGRCVSCMSNIYHLTTAYIAYCDANEGKLFPCDNLLAQGGSPPDQEAADIPELTTFAGDSRLFHCIEDARESCRSYSINDYLGGTFPFIGLKHVRELKDVKNSAQTFLFIEDTPPKSKNGYTGGFVVLQYPLDRWVDIPAILHPRGTCLSFVDGHAEFWQWADDRTRSLPLTPFFRTASNPDLVRLQSVTGQGGTPVQ